MEMREEDIIRKIEGQQNPFRTPENYFEDFNERLAARLPEWQEKKAATVPLIPRFWRYAAAFVVVLGIGSALYWNHNHSVELAYNNEEASQETYFENELDYCMVDNMEIAAYLTAAE